MAIKIPIIIQLSDQDVSKSNLLRDLRIDQGDLDRQLRHYPGIYTYWSQLYATTSARVSRLKEQLEQLEARLYPRAKDLWGSRDAKKYITLNSKYRRLRKKLRHWEDAERHAKFAEKAMDKKGTILAVLNANQRRERERS